MTDRDWCNAQPDAAELNEAFDLAIASGVVTRSTIASLIHKLQAARADAARLDALRDLVKRNGARVRFDLTCGGSRVTEWRDHATILLADDPGSERDDLRDALDDLIERMRPSAPAER